MAVVKRMKLMLIAETFNRLYSFVILNRPFSRSLQILEYKVQGTVYGNLLAPEKDRPVSFRHGRVVIHFALR